MKINVNKYIAKAFSLARKGDSDGARGLYNAVLQSYPNNLRAQEGLAGLDKPNPEKNTNPPQQQLDALIGLYNKGLLSDVT